MYCYAILLHIKDLGTRYLASTATVSSLQDLDYSDRLSSAKLIERTDIAFSWANVIDKTHKGHVKAEVMPVSIHVGHHPDMIGDVMKFAATFGHPMSQFPHLPPPATIYLRNNLNYEEFFELLLGIVKAINAYKRMQTLQGYLHSIERVGQIEQLPKAVPQDLPKSIPDASTLAADLKVAEMEYRAALAEIVDSIGDLIYVLIGQALAYGLPLIQVWDAIQEANMAKLWSTDQIATLPDGWYAEVSTTNPNKYLVHNEAGKVQKPTTWTPPNIIKIINTMIDTCPYKIGGGPDSVSEEAIAISLKFKTLREFYQWRLDCGDTSITAAQVLEASDQPLVPDQPNPNPNPSPNSNLNPAPSQSPNQPQPQDQGYSPQPGQYSNPRSG